MDPTVAESLARSEKLIAIYDRHVEKYAALLGRTPVNHACFESIELLLRKEKRRLVQELDYRQKLLGRLYYELQK
ncbi:hypothetical protein [Pseudomonas benzopyrenica]|uniref:hypothetical protein n=1 Tax=Pseudomonas benzopyrenica TaxID=2993566 RepID=UPI00227E1ED4|nr:hypothetical protein [Pseudomonas benzopyrenica]MDC7831609.1 hypothetical protein [Pseudomonas benzopyrenica]